MDLSKQDDFTVLGECPHCRGKLEMQVGHKPNMERQVRKRTGGPAYSDLTILCVTDGEGKAQSFLRKMRNDADRINAYFQVVVDNSKDSEASLKVSNWDVAHLIGAVKSSGYIESVLNTAYEMTHTTYVLRLDDDESLSSGLLKWLCRREYLASPKWRIPTMAVWPNKKYFIMNSPLWPDPHLRLTSWRHHPEVSEVHNGMDSAPDTPYALLHWKYLTKSYEKRLKLAEHYDSIKEGAGTGPSMPFTLPEHSLPNGVLVAEIEDGSTHYRENLLSCDWSGKIR